MRKTVSLIAPADTTLNRKVQPVHCVKIGTTTCTFK